MKRFALTLMVALTACTSAPRADTDPQAVFMARLNELCGQRFEGRVVSTDAADADMASQRLVMHVRDCTAGEVRIPFAVGADRSRTWVVSLQETGLRLKHDHRHEDGTEDALSQYGGDSQTKGSATRQEFPADEFSKELFRTKGNPASVTNVWAMEATGNVFAYELRRSQRFFRVEFDLTRPVAE
jgi:hypothetical protein